VLSGYKLISSSFFVKHKIYSIRDTREIPIDKTVPVTSPVLDDPEPFAGQWFRVFGIEEIVEAMKSEARN
jgi:hypothetical protein